MGRIYSNNTKVANTDLLNPSYLVPGSNKVYEDFVLALKII